MNGIGEFIWDNGERRYIGYFLNEKKNGFGIYLWTKPLKVFIGFWEKGIQTGFGKYMDSKKQKCGIWKNGKKVKSVKLSEINEYLEPELRRFIPFFSYSLEKIQKIIKLGDN
jgi:hypothetical protein